MGVAVGSYPSGMPMSMHSRIDQGSSVECSIPVCVYDIVCMSLKAYIRHNCCALSDAWLMKLKLRFSKCTVTMGRDHGHPYIILSTTVLN